MSESPAAPPSSTDLWSAVGDRDFVQLTTFRRSGEAVPTPVWVVRDGADLLVTTPAGSGKLKRLRHTPRVELRPCSRRGSVEPGAPTVIGTAVVDPDPNADEGARHLFLATYGMQYRIAMAVEKVARLRRKDDGPARRIIRITPA